MNKRPVIGAIVGLGVIACAATCARSGTCQKDRAQKQKVNPVVWEKMRRRMEEMPEDFPPRVMFDNVEATKANTEQILGLLAARAGEPLVSNA